MKAHDSSDSPLEMTALAQSLISRELKRKRHLVQAVNLMSLILQQPVISRCPFKKFQCYKEAMQQRQYTDSSESLTQ